MSPADIEKFPSRESLSSAVLEIWNSCGIRVVQWVVCIEGHSNDCESVDEMNLYRCHMALKLAKRARWLQDSNYLDENFGTQVNFSDNHSSYFTAYRYATEDDKDALHSKGYADLSDDTSRTEQAIRYRKDKGKSGKKRRSKATESLIVYNVCQIVQAKGSRRMPRHH